MMKKLIVNAVAASMLLGLLPTMSWAGDESQTTSGTPVRAAMERAARAAIQPSAAIQPAKPFKSSRSEEMQSGSGGGGGHVTAIVVTLVTTAASLGATYYIMKEMKKQTGQAR
jgi:hypothetical protein